MKTRKLHNITVSEIGMGCMGFSHGYGALPDEDYAVEAIRKAHEAGCTFFDTAEAYGPNLNEPGHNERILGRAVRDFRDEIVIATKFFITADEVKKDGSVLATISRHLEASLKRLDTDYADLYYLHRISPDIPVEAIAEAMSTLISEEVIHGWGLSMVNAEILDRASKICHVSAVQNIYSMMDRAYEKAVIPYCMKNDIGFVAFSPTASGYLSGKVSTDTKFEGDDVRKWVPQMKRENIIANRPLLEVLKDFADRKAATMAQISLAWMLKKYECVVPIPGSKNQERILENLGACEVVLSDGEFRELEEALGRIEIHGSRKDLNSPREFID
ncbi:MAG: aldo/keto reductase [Synergistaceae bacterium]|nr:aldo/keto reductase [Synergistaceae bacterium]